MNSNPFLYTLLKGSHAFVSKQEWRTHNDKPFSKDHHLRLYHYKLFNLVLCKGMGTVEGDIENCEGDCHLTESI